MQPHRRRARRHVALAGALALAALASDSRPAGAFAGEDPVLGGPWYHEVLTRDATTAMGFSPHAVDVIAWHADYIDSYLYNPQFWAFGGLSRFKAAQATFAELAKLHFDDNGSTPNVNAAWRRYISGAMAGLLWAADHDDVDAARNILGVTLHATQDFYAHSSWVNTRDQRHRTWFETADGDREGSWLYTGFYEHPDHLGIISHGKISADCTIMQTAAIEVLLDIGCVSFSPISNSATCRSYRSCQDSGEAGSPDSVLGVPIPEGVVYYNPPGIALDSRWLSEIGARQRGITDISASALFDRALDDARQSSVQVLSLIEDEMIALGEGEFWTAIKTRAPAADKERQYEQFDRFPYQFLSAGPYPDDEEDTRWYLRVTLDTADISGAGTDADIDLVAGGQRFRLDYMPDAGALLAYNDFERGDRQVYTVGPFATMPTSIRLENTAADFGDIAEAAVDDFVDAVEVVVDEIGSFLLSLVAGHADHIETGKVVWTPAALAGINSLGQPFTVALDGEDEGNYEVTGVIRRLGETSAGVQYQVWMQGLHCIDESDWDRGSNSDEPFVISAMTPLPGTTQSGIDGPYGDVDSGDTEWLSRTYTVTVPPGYGAIALALSLWEHDDEGSGERADLHDEFVHAIDMEVQGVRDSVTSAVGASISPNWAVGHVRVHAFTRGATVASGEVLDYGTDHWIDGNASRTYVLGPAPAPRVLDIRRLEQLFPVAELVAIVTGG